jgi:hypothetical protein
MERNVMQELQTMKERLMSQTTSLFLLGESALKERKKEKKKEAIDFNETHAEQSKVDGVPNLE